MKNVIILISGVPGVGKSTLAKWLSVKMRIPLICYDNIIAKYIEIEKTSGEDREQYREIFRRLPSGFFWFFCEEIMKSSSMLIADYFFMNEMKEQIDDLVGKYQYQTVNIHLDASEETVYCRFNERNRDNPTEFRKKEVPFEQFVSLTKSSKEFQYGDYIIRVDTTDFNKVSYEDIAAEAWEKVNEICT